MIDLTCACSATSSTKMSPSGGNGGTGDLEQSIVGGCTPALIAATIGKPISEALVAQAGSITTTFPVAALIAPANAGIVNTGAAINTGALATCTTPINTPLMPGAPLTRVSIIF